MHLPGMHDIADLCKGSTADSDSVCLGSNPRSAARKTPSCLQDGVFQLYSPCGEFYAQVRDMSFGRGMRFARWKLQGEYNITVSVVNNITFAKQKYHADEVSISLNSLQLAIFML